MTESLIPGAIDIPKFAAEFRKMADRLEKNADSSFGGCFVLISPAGQIYDTLILDNNQDLAQFFALLQTKCTMALAWIDEQQRKSGYR